MEPHDVSTNNRYYQRLTDSSRRDSYFNRSQDELQMPEIEGQLYSSQLNNSMDTRNLFPLLPSIQNNRSDSQMSIVGQKLDQNPLPWNKPKKI